MSEKPGESLGSARPSGRGDLSPLTIGLRLLSFGPVLILFILVVVISFLTPHFLKSVNLTNIAGQMAVIAIVAMGQHLVILTRGIDLSVGSNLALATVIGGLVFKQTDSTTLVVLAMVGTGALVGFVNGAVYVFGRLPHPFIITLATLSICRGLALEFAPGHTTMRGMPDGVVALGQPSPFSIPNIFVQGPPIVIPNAFWVVVAVAVVLVVMARFMVWGRWIYAVGGKPEAAVQMGIPVKAVLISTYVLAGVCAGIGALVLAGRTEAASPIYGNLLELDTIAAVIIGGASFLGGRGHIGHALVGALMIGVIRNALNLLNVDVFFQMIAIGLVIVIAVEADVLRNYLESRVRVMQAARMQ
jgi:ribose transport system permease protein